MSMLCTLLCCKVIMMRVVLVIFVAVLSNHVLCPYFDSIYYVVENLLIRVKGLV